MNAAAQLWPADHVERRPIDELIPYARNARTHSDSQVAQLAASMREWGWTMPVLVDESGTIIAGHGRILAARQLGWNEAPVMIARDWSEAQKRAYVIADNQLALNASWDTGLLAIELDDLRDLSFDMPLIGFSAQHLNELIGTPNAPPLDSMPQLPDGDKSGQQQMTFVLRADQADVVRDALMRAKAQWEPDSPDDNENGCALTRICETFLPATGAS